MAFTKLLLFCVLTFIHACVVYLQLSLNVLSYHMYLLQLAAEGKNKPKYTYKTVDELLVSVS